MLSASPPQPLPALYWLLVMPTGMLVAWLVVLAGGQGQLDALGNPWGGDFAMFYQAGQTASLGLWEQLYDEPAQQQRLLVNFPGLPADTYLPYRYPPLTAIILMPLGMLPIKLAWAIFVGLSLLAWALTWRRLAGNDPLLRGSMPQPFLWLLMFSPVMAQALIDGQASLFWFAVTGATWWNIRQERFVWGGIWLALAALKPNVMALLAVVWLVRYPRLLLGLIPSGLVMFGVTVSLAGWECLAEYVQLARQLASGSWPVETPYWKVQSLLSWSQLLLGQEARRINLLMGLGLAVGLGVAWRRASFRSENPCWTNAWANCGALVINALFNPYTPVYDWTLLSLGMFLVLQSAAQSGQLEEWFRRRDWQVAGLCLWLGPIVSQNLASFLHCPQQVMPLWLCAVTLTFYTAAPRSFCATAKGIVA